MQTGQRRLLGSWSMEMSWSDSRSKATRTRHSSCAEFDTSKSHPMRRIFVLLHRYVGLALAAFLIVTGLTGAVISWDHELDEWLNPHLIHAPKSGSLGAAQGSDLPAKTPLD